MARTLPIARRTGGIFVTKKDVSKKVDLIVVRVNKEGGLCISRPCCNCLSMMKAVNIRRVYYVDNTGNIVYENVSDMISIHASSVAYHIYTLKKPKTVNETMFFNDLLMKMFPSSVKKINFDTFLIWFSYELTMKNNKINASLIIVALIIGLSLIIDNYCGQMCETLIPYPEVLQIR